jgi:hypothetical protein
VWSLGNFGGAPPKSAMTVYQASEPSKKKPSPETGIGQTQNEAPDYRSIFNSCGVGMVSSESLFHGAVGNCIVNDSSIRTI